MGLLSLVPKTASLALGALNYFSKNRSDVELAGSKKKYNFQKVSKTKDLDMVKNFFS